MAFKEYSSPNVAVFFESGSSYVIKGVGDTLCTADDIEFL
jgi:hypothetical protein